uniref:Regulator of G-protein signaling 20 n=1 Tax=Oryzias latipes TaxID=8090 RepID=A0A3P9JQB0_ORYLA
MNVELRACALLTVSARAASSLPLSPPFLAVSLPRSLWEKPKQGGDQQKGEEEYSFQHSGGGRLLRKYIFKYLSGGGKEKKNPQRTGAERHWSERQYPHGCASESAADTALRTPLMRRLNEEERRKRRRRWKKISQDNKMEPINCEACTKPSVEEIRLWSQSFDKLMRNPAGRNVFREFLRTEYSEENMLFWLACEDLKQEANKSAIEEKACSIYEDYISILSPKEVSLDARVREVINRKMQDPTPHTFEDAQLQIYTLMHRDSYPRFLSSNIYKALIHGGSRTSSES